MDPKKQVKLLASGLHVGEDSGFTECPFCQVNHEEKFSVTRLDTGLVYNCFRASCGAKGFISTGYWEAEYGEKPVRPKQRPYVNRLHTPSDLDNDFFRGTWGIEPYGFKVTHRDEFALPMEGPAGNRRGWVIRQPVWKGRECHRKGVEGKPKALTYKDRAEDSRLAWASFVGYLPFTTDVSRGISKHIVLVEDILSAYKVSQSLPKVATGVALNGVDLGYQEVIEIGKESPLVVSIFLDPDATNAAYRIQAKWGLSFNYCRVITADRDPKDIDKEELEALLVVDW